MALEYWVTSLATESPDRGLSGKWNSLTTGCVLFLQNRFTEPPLDAQGSLRHCIKGPAGPGTLVCRMLTSCFGYQPSALGEIQQREAKRCSQSVCFLTNWVMGRLRQAQYLCLINKLGQANARNWLMPKKETLAKHSVPASFPFQGAICYSSQNFFRNSINSE